MEGNVRAYVRWMRLRGLSAETIDKRYWLLSRLAERVAKPLTEVTREDLERWQDSLSVTDSSRQRYVSIVTCFYGWMIRDERLERDPSRWLVAPKVPRRMPRPIGEDDLEAAIAAAGEPVRCWLILAAYAGLRGGEIARLQRGDVYDRIAVPHLIVRGKGSRERTVPASLLVLTALHPHLGITGPLFRDHDGRPVRPAQVARPCNDHLHGLGIAETLHKARARFATRVHAEAGYDLRLTQDLLGHASPATTAIYVAWAPERAAAAVNALDKRRNSA